MFGPVVRGIGIAASPRGRKLLGHAVALARSEEGRKALAHAHRVATGPQGRELIGRAAKLAASAGRATAGPGAAAGARRAAGLLHFRGR